MSHVQTIIVLFSVGNVTEDHNEDHYNENNLLADNFSNRISEILNMPTPQRKLQPILKPIVNNSRPKAAFKRRTPPQTGSSKVRASKGLNLRQMLNPTDGSTISTVPSSQKIRKQKKEIDLPNSISELQTPEPIKRMRSSRSQIQKTDVIEQPSQSDMMMVEDHIGLESDQKISKSQNS